MSELTVLVIGGLLGIVCALSGGILILRRQLAARDRFKKMVEKEEADLQYEIAQVGLINLTKTESGTKLLQYIYDASGPTIEMVEFAQQLYSQGLAHYEAKDIDSAIRDYDIVIRLNPDYAEAYYGRGRARYDRGDLDVAIQDFSRAIATKPDYVDAYEARAFARMAIDDSEGAISDLNKAHTIRRLILQKEGGNRSMEDVRPLIVDYDERSKDAEKKLRKWIDNGKKQF